MNIKKINLPLTKEEIKNLHAGDYVYLSGIMYSARDAAHKRMTEEYEKTGKLPIDIKGETIYYLGPSPAAPGQVIGSAGPTTSGRMDKYTPLLLELGMNGMIGKGRRTDDVKKSIVDETAIYFAAVGGAGALLSKCIKEAEIVAYPDLVTEAIYKLKVEDFPCIVVIDCEGNDLYQKSI